MDISELIPLLEQNKNVIAELYSVDGRTESEKFIEWQSFVRGLLRRIYGEKTPEYKEFDEINYYSSYILNGDDPRNDQLEKEGYERGLKTAKALLTSHIAQLKILGLPEKQAVVQRVGDRIVINPVFNQNNNQSNNQSQSQTQTTNVSLEMQIEKAIEEIEEHYGGEAATQGKAHLEELKANPSKWAVVQKAASFFLNLGKEAFMAVLPVLTKILLPVPVI